VQNQHVSVRTELSDQLPQLAVNQVQLRQVIVNLVMNAVDAMSIVAPHERVLSLTLANLGGVGESVFDAAPDMARNFYTVSAWPGHARNLMMPYFAANHCDGIAEGEN
jgi:C4-dicarboxylate-specific signal transduction histidine kinase